MEILEEKLSSNSVSVMWENRYYVIFKTRLNKYLNINFLWILSKGEHFSKRGKQKLEKKYLINVVGNIPVSTWTQALYLCSIFLVCWNQVYVCVL